MTIPSIFLYLILLLLLLLLSQTPYVFAIIFFILIVSLFFKKRFKIQKKLAFLFFIWTSYVLVLGTELFFTASFPLSFSEFVIKVFFFLSFGILISQDWDFVSWELFINGILCVILVISFTLLGSDLFPNYAINFPGMNIISSAYGHVHIAALIIMILPYVSSKFFQNDREKKISHRMTQVQLVSYVIWIVLFSILILSFGRWALAVGIFVTSLFMLYSFFSRRKSLDRNEKYIFTSITLFSVTSFVFLSIFLISPYLIDHNLLNCRSFKYGNFLCKQNNTIRITYWRQAVLILRSHPLLGYGPGTFSLIATKEKTHPKKYSSFAHNAFLENFAESGIIGGGLFFTLHLYLLFLSYKKMRSESRESELVAIFLGLLGSYLNALMDFDWSFHGIYFLTLIFVILILKYPLNGNKLSQTESNNS